MPGTAYDFGKSKSAGPTYHTDASHPTGYGYQAPVAQYHSQPAYGHSGGGHGGGGGYKAGKETKSGECASHAERFILQTDAADKHPPSADKQVPVSRDIPAGYTNVIGVPLDRRYGVAMKNGDYNDVETGYSDSVGYGKVGHDDLARPAGYISGSYEAVGYGYMY